MGKYGGGNKGGQRFKKNRVHSMVTPGASGFLFTVDPYKMGNAIRETQSLLDSYSTGMFSNGVDEPEKPDEDGTPDADDVSAPAEDPTSLSSLLMAELSEVKKPERGEEQQRANKAKRTGPRVLETNCKGYMFFGVPAPPREREVNSGEENKAESDGKRKRENEDDEAPTTAEDDTLEQKRTKMEQTDGNGEEKDETTATQVSEPVVPTVFRFNDNVNTILGRMMEDLITTPKPVVRFTHKMIPVQLTCFPTKKFLLPACKQLCATIPMPEGRSAIRLGVNFIVRNNSNVEKEAVSMRMAIESSLPMNRYIVIGQKGSSAKLPLDAMLNVCIIHSTACLGISPAYTDRRSYNLHDISQAALATQLSSGVTKDAEQ